MVKKKREPRLHLKRYYVYNTWWCRGDRGSITGGACIQYTFVHASLFFIFWFRCGGTEIIICFNAPNTALVYRLVWEKETTVSSVGSAPNTNLSYIEQRPTGRREKKKMSRFSLHRSGKRHVRPHCNLRFTSSSNCIMPWRRLENILNLILLCIFFFVVHLPVSILVVAQVNIFIDIYRFEEEREMLFTVVDFSFTVGWNNRSSHALHSVRSPLSKVKKKTKLVVGHLSTRSFFNVRYIRPEPRRMMIDRRVDQLKDT